MPAQNQRRRAPANHRGAPARSHSSRSPKAKRPQPQAQPSELDRMLEEATARPAPEQTSFAELGVPEALVTALKRRGIDAPFAIQARALPDALAGRDVLGRAQTGSGKTLAFGLPMLARLVGSPLAARHIRAGSCWSRPASSPCRSRTCFVPSATLSACASRPSSAVRRYGRQIDALSRGVDVVVATPGRLIDLIDRRACSLSEVSMTVLDEADHMADLGFLPAMVRLLDDIPTDRPASALLGDSRPRRRQAGPQLPP